MRRMLDPTKVGGIPSTIEFDKDGNRKVKKDLGVDGKLKLKSLVSSTNPDGDITKELGGGGGTQRYNHTIQIYNSTTFIVFNLTITRSTAFTSYSQLFSSVRNKYITASGYIVHDNKNCAVISITPQDSYSFYVGNYDMANPSSETTLVAAGTIRMSDMVE